MASISPKVYVPIAPANAKIIDAPIKIDIPSYPDKGTAYAGFSKSLFTGNQYRLNPQSPFDFNILWSPTASTSTTLLLSGDANSEHYITAIHISSWQNVTGNELTIVEAITGRTIFKCVLDGSIVGDNGIKHIVINPIVPIKLKDNRVTASVTSLVSAGSKIIFNIYGWQEAA